MSATSRATPQRKQVPPELHAARAIAAMNAANAAAPLLSVLNAGGLLSDGRTRTTLVDGQSAQAWSVASCTKSDDTTLIKEGTQSKRFTFAGAVTATATLDPVFPSPAPDPLTFPPASVVRGWFWVDDPTAVTSLTLSIYSDSAGTVAWSRSFTGLTRGWNAILAPATAGVLTGWGSAYRVRLVVVTSAATAINVGAIWVESTRKAQILLIADRGYTSFRDNGVPALRSRGIPVTWALDPTLNGGRVGTPAEVVTESDLASFFALGDDISFHSYDGTVTSSKSKLQIVEDAARAHKYLQDKGYYRGSTWRAAWVQNSATNHAAAQPFFACYATPSSASALTCWPPPDRWNIPRIGLHSLSTATMDTTFASMQATNGLLVCYLHGIDTTSSENITPTNWAYFLSKLDDALAGGWLEGVTMSQLLAARPAPVGSISYGVPGGVPQVNSWTTAQTDTAYSIPAGAKTLFIRAQAGAGAGGSGRRGAAGSIRCAGGGGSAGAYTEWQVNVGDLAVSTLYVTAGAAGTPGAAVTVNDTNGNAGTAGGDSYVTTAPGSVDITKSLAYARGGQPGAGGTASTGTGGTAASGRYNSGAGGAASVTGGVGGGGAAANSAPGSGAAGGGVTSADVASAGGAGGSASGRYTSNPAAGTAGGGNGANSGVLPVLGGGQGGAGGGGSITGAGGTGGNGGPGAGSGGGGASLNGNNSGAGGTPGTGYVEITAFF